MKNSYYLKKYENRAHFMMGDEACAHGAIFAGCSFFGAYPITPASEIPEVLALELPRMNGFMVQFEDEIASISACIGATWAGAKAMTATSGPGFSLMQENIGYAVMTETPCVIVDVQRSGPSTGQATLPAQGDMLQARWGTHGDHEILALSPWSVQECFDLTIDCFNLAEKYRNPVILLMDGLIGHLREQVKFPFFDSVSRMERRKSQANEPCFGGELIPAMTLIGDKKFVHITGSTHKENGIRDVTTMAVHDRLIRRIVSKIRDQRADLVRLHEYHTDDAEILVVAYGATARPAFKAVKRAREKGLKVGFLRLIQIWPFADEFFKTRREKYKKILVPEMNLGQINREIERFVHTPVKGIWKIGGIGFHSGEILEEILSNF